MAIDPISLPDTPVDYAREPCRHHTEQCGDAGEQEDRSDGELNGVHEIEGR